MGCFEQRLIINLFQADLYEFIVKVLTFIDFETIIELKNFNLNMKILNAL